MILSWIGQITKEEESDEPPRLPYAYDYVNGRPIYPEDTVYLKRNPYKYDEWVPKTELHKLKKKPFPAKKFDSTQSYSLESEIEGVVNSMLD